MKPSAVRVALHDSSERLEEMLGRADATDIAEGQLAYPRYHEMMRTIADRWNMPLDRTIAAFVSLSPNNDYVSNLRSTISVLEGVRCGIPPDRIVVSTYNHCKLRAHDYLTGAADFETATRGLKILNFYHNLRDPQDPRWVTIDGHMVGAWQGQPLVMRAALISPRDYLRVKARVIELAAEHRMAPCALQATIWFARKRVLGVKYTAQLSMFHEASDAWRTVMPLETIPPYKFLEDDNDNQSGTTCKRTDCTGRGDSSNGQPTFV